MMPEQGIVEECLNDSKSDSYHTEMNELAQEIEELNFNLIIYLLIVQDLILIYQSMHTECLI